MNLFAEENDAPKKAVKLTGSMADKLFDLKEKLATKNAEVKALEAEISALQELFINNLPKDSSGIMGKKATVRVTTKVKPTVEDWPALYAYIKRTGSFELLQKRLGEAAVKERWDENKTIPGVGKFNVVGLSITQAKK